MAQAVDGSHADGSTLTLTSAARPPSLAAMEGARGDMALHDTRLGDGEASHARPDFVRLISADVPPPPCVQIETTTRCNLRCIMCPKGANGEVMADLDVSVLGRLDGLIDNAWEIRAHGFGETFLTKHFETILRRCGDAQASISIVTNGTLINERRARLLVDAGVAVMYVSIDAADPELFYTIRKTSLQDIIDNLLRLQAIKAERGVSAPRIALQMVGMNNNIHDLPGMLRLAASIGADEVQLVSFTEFAMETVQEFGLRSLLACPDEARRWLGESQRLAKELGIALEIAAPYRDLVPAAEIVDAPPPLAPPPLTGLRRVGAALRRAVAGDLATVLRGVQREARHHLARAMSRLAFATHSSATESAANGASAADSSIPAPHPPPRLSMTPRVRCQDPWNAVMINHKGEVNPCCMSQRVMGDVNTSTFEEIWNGDVYSTFREQLLSTEPPTECRNCAKAGWYHPFELDDWIEAGVNDSFGVQLGTGWCEGVLNGIRWSRREAILHLRNSGKCRLRLLLASWSDPRHGNDRCGAVYVNDALAGDFAVSSLDARPFTYDLPPLESDEVVVRIVCDWDDDVDHDPQRLGIGLRSAALVD